MIDNMFNKIEGLRVQNRKFGVKKRSLPPLKALKCSEVSMDLSSSCADLDYSLNESKFKRSFSEKVLLSDKIQESRGFVELDSVASFDGLGSNFEGTPTFRKNTIKQKYEKYEETRNHVLFPNISKRLIKVNSRLKCGLAEDKSIAGHRIVKRIKVLQHKFPKDMFYK